MSVQMTMRVSDEAAEFIDQMVTEGFDSRAAFVSWLVEREAQREAEGRRVMRMLRDGVPLDDPELDGLAKAVSGTPLDIA